MAVKVDVYMPLYLGDYLRDTADLNAEEHGAYLLLLMAMWTNGGGLPMARLERIARVPGHQWATVWATLSRFFTVTDGVAVQGRLARELEAALARRETARENGLKGGRPKNPRVNQRVKRPVNQPGNRNETSSSPTSPSDPSSEATSTVLAPAAPPAPNLVAIFCEEYRAAHGRAYQVSPADAGQGMTLRKGGMDPEAWRAMCKRYVVSAKPFYAGSSWPLRLLATNLNEFTIEALAPARDVKRGWSPPAPASAFVSGEVDMRAIMRKADGK